MVTPITDAKCAACGKGGDSLKGCTACKLVKYCSIECQRAHRPQHKKECRKRAAELHDEALFKQPPSREECPICFLELPLYPNMQVYNACCGKIFCNGCEYAHAQQADEYSSCPFCRESRPRTDEEKLKQIERRVELNDPEAMDLMGHNYFNGVYGLQQDTDKGLEFYQKAAEYGSIDAHFYLGAVHNTDNGVQGDKKKTKYYWEIAAMGGNVVARYNLGLMEGRDGNLHRAMKHYTISANAGDDGSLKKVQCGYRIELVSKDDFEKILQAHKKSQDEVKSEWRDRAAAANYLS